MRRSRLAAAAVITVLGLVFGAVGAQCWGSDNNLVYWIGNISSTYLLLAFISGRAWFDVDRRTVLAAAAGLIATMLALAAFYGWAIWRNEVYAGSAEVVVGKYVEGGLITGSLFGYLGGLQVRLRSWVPAIPLAAAFALEPIAWLIYGSARPMPGLIGVVEIAAAAGVLVVAMRRRDSPAALL